MKLLFFYGGRIPTEKEKEEAKKLGAVLRSRMAYKDGDFIESCDGVAGDYPDAYAKFAPKGQDKKPKAEAEEAEPVEELTEPLPANAVDATEQDGLEAVKQVLKRNKKTSS